MLDSSASPLFQQYLSIAWHLAGKLDFNSAIRAVAEHIALIVPHDHMDVCIIMPGSRFHMAYESGFETQWSKRTEARIEESPLKQLLTGEVDTMLTGNAMTDPAFHFEGSFVQPIMEHKLKARVHVALKVRGETIGALSFSNLKPDVYTLQDVERARWIADLIAPYFFALRASDEAKRAAIAEAETRVLFDRENGKRWESPGLSGNWRESLKNHGFSGIEAGSQREGFDTAVVAKSSLQGVRLAKTGASVKSL